MCMCVFVCMCVRARVCMCVRLCDLLYANRDTSRGLVKTYGPTE